MASSGPVHPKAGWEAGPPCGAPQALELVRLAAAVAGLREEVDMQRRLVHLTAATYEQELQRLAGEMGAARRDAEARGAAETAALRRRVAELEEAVGLVPAQLAQGPSNLGQTADASSSSAAVAGGSREPSAVNASPPANSGAAAGDDASPSAKPTDGTADVLSVRQQLLSAGERARKAIEGLEQGHNSQWEMAHVSGELSRLQAESSRQWVNAAGVQDSGAVPIPGGPLSTHGTPAAPSNVSGAVPQAPWRKVAVPRAVLWQRDVLQRQWALRVGELQALLAGKARALGQLGVHLRQRLAQHWREAARKDLVALRLAEAAWDRALQEEAGLRLALRVLGGHNGSDQGQSAGEIDHPGYAKGLPAAASEVSAPEDLARLKQLLLKLTQTAQDSGWHAERALEASSIVPGDEWGVLGGTGPDFPQLPTVGQTPPEQQSAATLEASPSGSGPPRLTKATTCCATSTGSAFPARCQLLATAQAELGNKSVPSPWKASPGDIPSANAASQVELDSRPMPKPCSAAREGAPTLSSLVDAKGLLALGTTGQHGQSLMGPQAEQSPKSRGAVEVAEQLALGAPTQQAEESLGPQAEQFPETKGAVDKLGLGTLAEKCPDSISLSEAAAELPPADTHAPPNSSSPSVLEEATVHATAPQAATAPSVAAPPVSSISEKGEVESPGKLIGGPAGGVESKEPPFLSSHELDVAVPSSQKKTGTGHSQPGWEQPGSPLSRCSSGSSNYSSSTRSGGFPPLTATTIPRSSTLRLWWSNFQGPNKEEPAAHGEGRTRQEQQQPQQQQQNVKGQGPRIRRVVTEGPYHGGREQGTRDGASSSAGSQGRRDSESFRSSREYERSSFASTPARYGRINSKRFY